jgi:DNA polymerase
MAIELHIDVETFSSVDITNCGSYKYFESPDFEILILCYHLSNGIHNRVRTVDLAKGQKMPKEFIDALLNPNVEKLAHNANFERNAFKAIGYDVPVEQWHCSAVKAGYCGLPMSLDAATKALDMGAEGKSAEGKALIRYFSCLVKPTKTNGGRMRNLPKHNPEKWEAYKAYCAQDVVAEMGLLDRLACFEIPETERLNYFLDQKINDRGVNIDVAMATNAILIDDRFKIEVSEQLKEITGLANPNSVAQLKKWLSSALQQDINSLAKDTVTSLIKEHKRGAGVEVLKLRQMASSTSTKKYNAMISYAMADHTAHGLLYFYGGSRTGRWAGRAVQLQNLPRNKMKLLDEARDMVKAGDYEALTLTFDHLPKVLSQLIRTALIPKQGNVLGVADYSAIEGRITAWLAGEQWRLDVFAGDGKIYEASAAMMFNVPIESIGKGSEYRDKGKIAELALGFGGSVGALKTMGGEAMGLSEAQMKDIVTLWRKASPEIVKMWYEFEACAIKTLKIRKPVTSKLKDIIFSYEHKCLTIQLPNGRKLIYRDPVLSTNRWDNESIKYKGKNQITGQWGWVETYGGKLSENIIQAIARDLLADGMRRLDAAGFDIVMHVHDEVVADIPNESTDFVISEMCRILGEPVKWAQGLGTPAEGFITNYYKKD